MIVNFNITFMRGAFALLYFVMFSWGRMPEIVTKCGYSPSLGNFLKKESIIGRETSAERKYAIG